jgi:diguanylate cyclase (GGDEF)-like protein/PAS domain S-box-containing protein
MDEDRMTGGPVLAEVDYPSYFAALRSGRPILAGDAHTDPITCEFSSGYLTPLGIGAMLDVPVFIRGKLAGVVCHEHVGGTREWTSDEKMFAMAIGGLVALAVEIRRRQRLEADLRQSEKRFRSIVEAAPIPMLVTSYPDGICLYGNRAASRLSGVPYDEIAGRKAPDFYADPADRTAALEELAASGSIDGREVLLRRADGSSYWALLSVQPLDFAGMPALICGILDMSSQKALEEQLRHIALHDPLTGLPNRVYFFDLLRKELARARRNPSRRFAVLYLDLDDFKRINDQEGHDAGDALLAEVADRLRGSLRASDTPARMGGDEFTALLSDLAEPLQASRIAERIAEAMRAPITVNGREVSMRASIGVAIGDDSTGEVADLMREADAAMYRAKQAQRDSAA